MPGSTNTSCVVILTVLSKTVTFRLSKFAGLIIPELLTCQNDSDKIIPTKMYLFDIALSFIHVTLRLSVIEKFTGNTWLLVGKMNYEKNIL